MDGEKCNDIVQCGHWTVCKVDTGQFAMWIVDSVQCGYWTVCSADYVQCGLARVEFDGEKCNDSNVDTGQCAKWTVCNVDTGQCAVRTMCSVD